MNRNAPQRIATVLGEGGCYFLSLLYLSEKISGADIDPLEAYEVAVSLGMMGEDCFVKAPSAVLDFYAGSKWAVTKEAAHYATQEGELEILRYERPTPGNTFGHFVVGDGEGSVEWDPLGQSRTVKDGSLVSKRIARRIA